MVLTFIFIFQKKTKQTAPERKEARSDSFVICFLIKYYKGLFMCSEKWRKYAKKRVFPTNVIRVSY